MGFVTNSEHQSQSKVKPPRQFINRLNNYLVRWIELAKVEKTFEGLKDLFVKEQYLSVCPTDLALFLRERAPENLENLSVLAQQYQDAHKSRIASQINRRPPMTEPHAPSIQSTPNPTRYQPPRPMVGMKKCSVCGRTNHAAKDCYYKDRGRLAAMTTKEPMAVSSVQQVSRKVSSDTKVINVNKGDKEACCNMIHGSALELKCGCVVPVIVDACHSSQHVTNMPVTEGSVNGQKATVLRDTGCSTVVIRRSLINPEQLTGTDETCVLIDGTVRRTPVAHVIVDTPFYRGPVKAVCMRAPLYDIIIGNIEGAKDQPSEKIETQEEPSEEQVQAVVTRHQAKIQQTKQKSLKVMTEIDSIITREELIKRQKDDVSMQSLWKKVNDPAVSDNNQRTDRFEVKRNLLYRICKANNGQEITQLVVPCDLRPRVMQLAHDAIMSGHQGVKKTHDRVWVNFWWPGLAGDVTRFCRSCDICQRTVSK